MRNIVPKTILVILLTLLAMAVIYPPSKQLKLGRDLQGGVNFVYQVNIEGDVASRQAAMDRVKEVVKDRLDPKGLLDISVVQQGADRLEISMPLASPEIRKRNEYFEEQLAALAKSSIDALTFDRIMEGPVDQREKDFKQYAGGADGSRWELFKAAIDAYVKMVEAKAPYDAAAIEIDEAEKKVKEADPATIGQEFYDLLVKARDAAKEKASQLADPFLDAEKDYHTKKDAALATGVSAAEVRRILKLRNDPIRVNDPKNTKEKTTIPSRRKEAIETLIKTHPALKDQIQEVVNAWDDFEKNRTTLNDPSDLVRLLKGAGVLNFRIAVASGEMPNERELRDQLHKFGPQGARADQARWYRINKIENWFNSIDQAESLKANAADFFRNYIQTGMVGEELDGEYYILLWDTKDKRLTENDGKRWTLKQAYQGTDERGFPAIHFTMDGIGSDLLGELTGQNVDKQMAVILDDEVYTAPRLQNRISSNGMITGEFSAAEINYVIKVLSHGSLEGKLSKEPISVQVVAAESGADNLKKGLLAGVAAFVLCSAFMIFYYFGCGVLSVLALSLNALFIVAAMAIQNSPFTLPGIAGIALVFGQAIDANVLIYERMREELQHGHDLKTSVRLGYDKALSSIVDGNVTTMIVCIALGFTGTQEVKGFAITLGLGNVMTLFTQLFVTRIVFAWLVEKKNIWRKASMLPIAVPAINRAFTFNLDWMKYRFVFLSVSLFLTIGSIALVAYQGREMFGSEFRGGTKVTIRLGNDKETGTPKKLTRAEIAKLIDDAAAAEPDDQTLQTLKAADIVVINPDPNDQTRSSEFSIKTSDTRAKEVQGSLVRALGNVIDAQPQLTFKDSDKPSVGSPAFAITEPELGKNILRETVKNTVSEHVGGIAIVLDDISPPVSLRSIEERLSGVRRQPDFQDVSSREQKIFVLRGSEEAVKSAVIVVHDPAISYFDSRDRWNREMKDREWALIQSALTQSTTLSNVESFSPQIARTFQAQAIIAVLLSTILVVIYVWVRFGSLSYSLAAIVTTLHDCLVAVGAIALAQILCEIAPGPSAALGILPFKLDLNLVAAVLTILGFSLNDTIIVMDRIRETKGKLAHASRAVINESINKTLSRTIITSGTTFFAVIVLYCFGGEAVRGFSYAMLIGVFVGTYSSIAVAAPLVWSEKHDEPIYGPPKL